MTTQRSLRSVPLKILALLLICLTLQLMFASTQPKPQAQAHALGVPPSTPLLRLISFGEPIALAQMMTLYLQAFDNKPGISIPFNNLDYPRVAVWLSRILELDPHGQYPLMMASQLYSQVPDTAKQRYMLAFVYRAFLADPAHRWPWLAHAAIMAKHRLHDLPLALQYAQAIAKHAKGKDVPHWAQQMPIFILEEMGEAESAKIMLVALLANGTITDSHEIHFLTKRLETLKHGP